MENSETLPITQEELERAYSDRFNCNGFRLSIPKIGKVRDKTREEYISSAIACLYRRLERAKTPNSRRKIMTSIKTWEVILDNNLHLLTPKEEYDEA